MKEQIEKVKTADEQEWEFTMPMPETLDEAVELDGQEGVFNAYFSARKIHLQNTARKAFVNGTTREQVDDLVAKAKPGTGKQKQSMKSRATSLVMDKSYLMQNDPELKAKVQEDFVSGNFRAVVEALEDLE